jgi:hypothetical protein
MSSGLSQKVKKACASWKILESDFTSPEWCDNNKKELLSLFNDIGDEFKTALSSGNANLALKTAKYVDLIHPPSAFHPSVHLLYSLIIMFTTTTYHHPLQSDITINRGSWCLSRRFRSCCRCAFLLGRHTERLLLPFKNKPFPSQTPDGL